MTERGERGAALLEVVVALGLTGLVAAATTQIVGMGLTTLERAEAASSRGAASLATGRAAMAALTRVAPGDDAFVGWDDAILWRGVLPAADGWRTGIWRARADAATLDRCAALDPSTCEPTREPGLSAEAFSFAGPDGEWRAEWPAGAAPALIRLGYGAGSLVVAPRVRGFGG